MKIAFVILVYKSPLQLRYLIESLKHEDHWFFIHIDKTKTIGPFLDELNKIPEANIVYVRREKSYWGSYFCVKAIINAMKQAYDQPQQFDYFIHLSGQDYPVSSKNKIRNTLQQAVPGSFFYHFSLPAVNWNNGGMDRLQSFQFFVAGRRITINGKSKNFASRIIFFICKAITDKYDKGKQFFGGEFYFILHRSAVTILFNNLKNNFYLRQRLKFTLIPEEIYIPTMLFLQNGSTTTLNVQNETLRYINWEERKRSPKTLDETDLEKIKQGDFLFARKFDFETNPQFLDQVNESIK